MDFIAHKNCQFFYFRKNIFTEKKKLSKFGGSESKASYPDRNAVDLVGRKNNDVISLTTLFPEQLRRKRGNQCRHRQQLVHRIQYDPCWQTSKNSAAPTIWRRPHLVDRRSTMENSASGFAQAKG